MEELNYDEIEKDLEEMRLLLVKEIENHEKQIINLDKQIAFYKRSHERVRLLQL